MSTTGPGHEIVAGTAGRTRLRASHADREKVVDLLKLAYVQGRLTMDEFEHRIGQTLVSRTYGELTALIADIPAGSAAVDRPLRAPRPAATVSARRALAWTAGTIIPLAILAEGKLAYSSVFLAVVLIPVVTCLGIWALTTFARMIDAWDEARSRTRPADG